MATRRDFLRLAGLAGGAALVPESILKALAIPANRATGTIQDVQHVVILMQENRSFDHYFGSLRGVRGFNDPRPARMPNGKPVWYQPIASVKTRHYHDRGLHPEAEHVLPFYLNPKQTTEFQAGTDHGWSSGHQAWNNGHHNQWVTQKQDVMTMGYLQRQDVAYHYALADAFTLCDAYHCSVHANTAPNRVYLWSGTIDAQNAMGKKKNGPGFGERAKTNGYTWTTYPERLEKAGVSWKLYQGGTGIPGDPTDNYTDNSLEFFAQYQVDEGADPHGPLVTKGVTDRSLIGFREDCLSGKLAQVSWVVAPYKYSEHPEASPRDGAFYVNAVLDALTADPEVWAKTVFLINYDENDGLFDHVVPPMPPAQPQRQGGSGMVTPQLVEALQDEFIDLDKHPHERRPLVPGSDPGGLQPIGLGPRVPMLVISPWSTGGWVCSETFDHTSVLRFLEKRFGIEEPNINAWRRAVCGDLTSAFDFAGSANAAAGKFTVPAVLDSLKQPYSVPLVQTMPVQETGTRPARALPYVLLTHGHVDDHDGKFWIELKNEGKAGAAFQIRNHLLMTEAPRRYTVSAGARLEDYWLISDSKSDRKADDVSRKYPDYDLSLHGPNGFYTHFRGVVLEVAGPEVAVHYDRSDVVLTITNPAQKELQFSIHDSYADSSRPVTVGAGSSNEERFSAKPEHRWFDLSVTMAAEPAFLRRFAGHVETGAPSTSDPAVWNAEQFLQA